MTVAEGRADSAQEINENNGDQRHAQYRREGAYEGGQIGARTQKPTPRRRLDAAGRIRPADLDQ